ncbi:ADP-ribosylation/crystallin J1 [Hyella patelloides LEGE 07179]|uniref:ADP-ribosylation/crystallin J1 n=1 Tax=Hyella patelloides LEGE 07179 TaxID=945734 RepID=A0A563W3C6_9CYAN|nr:ADP-ribosylglycohydrolase family protein [Hyella patelloides]VEP18043.1 ADP-ribosylation/crystallin J1 [Hyella patelloides LEGE 07179]
MNQDKYNTATGCLLGALVGDAAGATLEFLEHDPTPEEVAWAKNMPGGGDLQVAPGQITDDGELTLCLARALSECEQFDLEIIARHYAEWVESRPFDMGFTTSYSLGSYRDIDVSHEGYAAVMKKSASKMCLGSKANGSLMRITPLGIWGHNLDIAEIANFAIQDTSLSHPNNSCGYAVACYCIAIATLIQHPGHRELAFNDARMWLDYQANSVKDSYQYHCWAEVSSWLYDAADNVNVPYFPHIGFIKIAFTHAFRHLLLGSDYENAIAETLRGGGDTDTNACIVGGLIGAAVGVDGIPENMRESVLNCDTTMGKHPRPAFLHPCQIEELIPQLLG